MSRYGLRVAHKGSSHLSGIREQRGGLKSSSFPWSPLTHEPHQLLCVSSTEHPSNAIFPFALEEVPTSTLSRWEWGWRAAPPALSHTDITAHTAALTSLSLFPRDILGFSAPSGCCRAEGLEADLRASAPHSQGAANTPAPKSEPEAVSALHCAGCSWDVGTQI